MVLREVLRVIEGHTFLRPRSAGSGVYLTPADANARNPTAMAPEACNRIDCTMVLIDALVSLAR